MVTITDTGHLDLARPRGLTQAVELAQGGRLGSLRRGKDF